MKPYLVFRHRALIVFPLVLIFLLLGHNHFPAALGGSILIVGFLKLVTELWGLGKDILGGFELPQISFRRREEF